MAKNGAVAFYYVFSIFILSMSLLCKATDEERKVYIVYMGSLPDGDPAYSPLAHHLSILHSVVEDSKLIGVRHYGSESARDEIGHGTHTASTVAGNAVKDVNFYGLANGTARGGVPAAKIAAYQVCIPCCQDHSLLAAFDDALADGVNIITISLGQLDPIDLDEDAIAIGAFHAMKKGILTSQAAGNLGLGIASVSSVAPWILTVAASNTDCYFVDKIVLASGTTLVGNSINTFVLNGTSFPLIYGKDAGTKNCTAEDARNCEEGCLDSDLVKGKIVVCDEIQGDRAAYKSGALGSVTLNEVGYNVSLVPLLASTTLMKEEYNLVRSYMNSTRDPQENIFKSEVIKEPDAPTVV